MSNVLLLKIICMIMALLCARIFDAFMLNKPDYYYETENDYGNETDA